MLKETVVICGAGIAGVATAYYLLKYSKNVEVVLIDKNQPLSFTTSKSGENFRDYWPQKMMRELVSDSIDLMEELRTEYGPESFHMEYSGYNFITHDKDNPIFGTGDQESTGDFLEEITNAQDIKSEYPFLSAGVEKILKIKNAGNIDVYALGSLMLRIAQQMGLRQLQAEIIDIKKDASDYKVVFDSKEEVSAHKLVIATGPFINAIASMLDFQFPISNTLQRKFIMPDPKGIIPKDMPFSIYADAQYLDWTTEEKDFFAAEEKYHWLLQKFPGGLHIKPTGEGIKLGWAFQTADVTPTWEVAKFDLFPQAVLKGASRFIPALAQYENNIPTPIIEYGGFYTRTKENWPLIGPTALANVFVVGALAGYGTMAACAAGSLCSRHILGHSTMPDYAQYFHPLRYKDAAVVAEMDKIDMDGQL